MRNGTAPRVGIFGIGLAAYWPQFDGLRERLEGYQRGIEARLEAMGAEVVSAGLVDTAQAARQAGETLAPRARPRAALHGDVCDVVAGASGRAGRRCARRHPQSSADAHARLRSDDDRRVARQLLGVLRPGDRGRIHARAHPLQNGDRDASRRRPGMGGASRVAGRGVRGAQPADCTHRLPRSHLSGDARPVLRLHAGARTDRRARRGAGDRRPRRARRVGRRRGDRAQGRGDPADVRSRRCRHRSDRGRDHARDLRVVGARRGRARPPGRGLRARRADLLLPRRRRQHRRARRRRPDRRQLAAHRARRAGRRRGRPEDEPRDAPARPARLRAAPTRSSTRSTSTTSSS